MLGDIFTVLGMLLIVAAILVLAYFSTKYIARMRFGSMSAGAKNGRMQVLDQLSMGTDLRLIVVRVGVRYLLLGLSANGIQTLAELTQDEALLWDEQETDQTNPNPPSFRASFLEVLKQKRK